MLKCFFTSLPTLCLFVFLMIIILAGLSSYIFVVLIYISLVINKDNFFIYLLGICVPSLEKSPFKFLDHFLNQINRFFCYWVVRVSHRINLLNIFSQSIGWLSSLVSFTEQPLSLMWPHFLIFAFITCAFGLITKNQYKDQSHEGLSLCFLLGALQLQVLCFTPTFTHFVLIICCILLK